MGRKKGAIFTGKDGKKYRITRVDERHEQIKRWYDADHFRTISTRVNGYVWARYNYILMKKGITAYKDLQMHIARTIFNDGEW